MIRPDIHDDTPHAHAPRPTAHAHAHAPDGDLAVVASFENGIVIVTLFE